MVYRNKDFQDKIIREKYTKSHKIMDLDKSFYQDSYSLSTE